MSSLKYEGTYEIQRNFFEENTDMDINKLNDLVGNKHLYCYVPEKDAHESSRSNSDTNEDESSKEENISPNNAKINSAGHKDWCICGHCKKEIRNRLFMLSRSCSDFRRVLWRKSMHDNAKGVSATFKGDLLEKETKIKNR